MIVNDIFSVDNLCSDVRIIRTADADNAEAHDLWNNWGNRGDLPFDLAFATVKYLTTEDDNTIVIGI